MRRRLLRLVFVASVCGAAQAAGAQPAAIYFSADMESGVTGWIADPPWAVTTETSHSGTHSWSDSPGGSYATGIRVVLRTPTINLGSAVNPRLTFRHIFNILPMLDDDILAADRLEIYAIRDDGQSVLLGRYYAAPPLWNIAAFDLTPFAGNQSLRIAFHLFSGPNFPSRPDGWHIDDVVVSEGPAPGAFAKLTPSNGAIGQGRDVTLSWTASAGATGYEVCYDRGNISQCFTNWGATSGTSVTLIGLSALPYSWQVRALNNAGATEADGGTWWRFSAGPVPAVVTGTATGITTSGPTLNGTANPNGVQTWGFFEWGLTTSYGHTTTGTLVGSGNVAAPIGGGVLTNLACGTIYHFRAGAQNSATTAYGSDATFVTECPAPTVISGAADEIGATLATLNGTASPNGWGTTAYFEYGQTTGYGSSTPGQALGPGDGTVAIGGGSITGLACHTLYHFRAVASNAGGFTEGADATFTTAACVRGDVDGDGLADLLWRHDATGQNLGWLMNGLTVATSGFLPTIADTNWEVKGTGDLNSDGKSDVLLRNKVTGQHIGWLMDGLTVASSGFLPTITDSNWDIKGVGDVNGDEKADVVLRNAVSGQNIGWLMNGLTITQAAFLPTIADINWAMVGVGDLNGDGKADLLWRNTVTGQDVGWLMNGLTVANAAFMPTIADINWQIAGVGDVNGDGKADVVLRNSSNGHDIGWLMDGLTVTNSAFLPTIADTNWAIAAIRDIDGDGKADVVMRNPATGQNVAWLMNGLTVVSSTFLPTIADSSWTVVGSR